MMEDLRFMKTYKNKNILNYYKFLHIEIFLNLFFKCLKMV